MNATVARPARGDLGLDYPTRLDRSAYSQGSVLPKHARVKNVLPPGPRFRPRVFIPPSWAGDDAIEGANDAERGLIVSLRQSLYASPRLE